MGEQSSLATDRPKNLKLSHLWEFLKANWALELIVIGGGVSLLFFVVKLASFDRVDGLFHITKKLRPGILRKVPEEIDSTYAKVIEVKPKGNDPSGNNELLFYSKEGQKVTILIRVEGDNSVLPVTLQVNGCPVREGPDVREKKELYRFLREQDFDLTPTLNGCNKSNNISPVNTLRIVTPDPAKVRDTFKVISLIRVHQTLHDHYENSEQAETGVEK